jgi:hypothetical protein
LREELYNTFLKAGTSANPPPPIPSTKTSERGEDQILSEADQAAHAKKLKEQRERAVREREMKVKAERGRVDMDIGRSRMGLNKEEDEQQFKCATALGFQNPVAQ